MVEINLYPWREKRAQYEALAARKTVFISVAATLLLALLAHVIVEFKIKSLQNEEANLQETLHAYQQEKERFLSEQKTPSDRAQHINGGQQLEEVMNSLLSAFQKIPINEVCLTAIEQVKNRFVISGLAGSPVELTDFLMQWDVTRFFLEVGIDHMHELTNQQAMAFSVHANLKEEVQGHGTV